MADLPTPDFLAGIRALYPSTTSYDPNLWAVVAAVSFSASNVAEAVPFVFKWALDELIQAQQRANTPTDVANAEQLALARKIREALLQSGLLSGMPRAITSLVALHKVMPEHLRETKPLRDTKKSPEECDKRGEDLFRAVYRDSAQRVQTLLHSAYPDLGWFCTTVGYGMTYGGTDVFTPIELIYVMVAALIAVDASTELGWHLSNARRSGAPLAETRAVRSTAMQVASRAGVVWKAGVPDVAE
ncbi:hypothetical protein K466DRAFT_587530 [Polyporus arcularius HHB13444]|uniref:Carboxymuconolactone decarboxylase-like domain-containing protein n=1 Tax=Polyporus arcularius HHB13444 TaxID=1314778 RepID=A0A5C3PJI0_9APHY|nr:hypothetical protein K466DRAFT_587530 [Polyporus arcularius HHB13444]